MQMSADKSLQARRFCLGSKGSRYSRLFPWQPGSKRARQRPGGTRGPIACPALQLCAR